MLNYRLKNYFILALILSFSTTLLSQNKRKINYEEKYTSDSKKAGVFIDVNAAGYPPTNFTIDQLVRNILIAGGSVCAAPNVSNVTVSPNQPYTDPERAWGYFNKGTTSFPFNDGIVLVTGKARRAGNVLETNLSDSVYGSIGSDPDLVTAINPNAPLTNAVAIEFDFVPNNSTITFNYIFASEEYAPENDFPCGDYSDGFALLLKKAGDPTYTNLAILPGSAGPVSVTNIVPDNFSCGPLNDSYFGVLNTTNTETNFNGRTIPLTATATVIPGQTYHFKMILADASDSSYDSAVFIQGGSFDIGMSIIDENGNPITGTLDLCYNKSILLKAQIAVVPNMTFQWYRNGVAIPGATSPSYSATQAGVYEVRTFVSGTQCQTASVTIKSVPEIVSTLKGGMICIGDRITLDAGAGSNYTYLWNNGATTQTIEVSTPGTYSVTIKDGVCSKTFTTQVTQAVPPVITSVAYSEAGSLTVSVLNPSGGALEYSLDNGITWQNSNVFTGVPKNTLISISVRVKTTSCIGNLDYFTFVMQNVITPNGDNVNDMIDFRGISEYNNFQAVISDRYGKEVFKAEKTRPFWDGFFQGKKLPTSSYWYQVTFDDPATKQLTVKTGWILLKNFE